MIGAFGKTFVLGTMQILHMPVLVESWLPSLQERARKMYYRSLHGAKANMMSEEELSLQVICAGIAIITTKKSPSNTATYVRLNGVRRQSEALV